VTTFARLWVILATSYLVASGLLAVVILHTIDLRFEILIQHAVIPFFQAAVLAWLAGAVSLRYTVREMGTAIRLLPIAGLWCITTILLVSYWLPFVATDLTRLLFQLSALEAITAAILLVTGSMAGARSVLWRVATFALLLTLFASNAVVPWFGALPRLLPSDWPLLARQAVLLWTLLLTFLALASAAASAVRRENCTSAFFLSTVNPVAITAALAVSLNWSFYSYPVEPWSHVFVTCVFIGATAALTAGLVLILATKAGEKSGLNGKPRTTGVDRRPEVGRYHEIGFIGLWLILTLTAIAVMASLHLLVHGQWSWGTTTWLSLALPPLVQVAWLRFSREARSLPATIRILAARHPRVSVVVLAELIVIIGLWMSTGLAEVDAGTSRLALAAYAALKVAVLGAAIMAVFPRGELGTSVLGSLATLAGAIGIWTALSGASMLLPVFGLLFVRLALAMRAGEKGGSAASNDRQKHPGLGVSTVDVLFAPALVLVAGDLFSPTEPLMVAAPMALSLIVFAASAAGMSLRAGTPGDDAGQHETAQLRDRKSCGLPHQPPQGD